MSIKRNHNRVSEEIEKKVVESYKELQNLHKVGRIYSLDPSTVSRIVKRNGLVVKKNKDGKDHPAWKGGITNKGGGYIGIWKPNHERADSGGYVYEHTLVWEEKTGKLPIKGEIIHHINLDKKDNSFENLYKCSHKNHAVLHRSIEKHIKPLMDRNIIRFCKEKGEYVLC